MTQTTIASFNVKNLIGPDQEYYEFQTYTPEEYAWKQDWLADQLMTLNADVTGFQEIFDEAPLRDLVAETDRRGQVLNDAVVPGPNAPYRRKAIFRKLSYDSYADAALAFAPNVNDTGLPGKRRPGVAILSRHGFIGTPEVIQDLSDPVEIPFRELTGEDAGHYRLSRLSRPILSAVVPMGRHQVVVYNTHLKSKLGEHLRPPGAEFAPEENLLNYDATGRALGSLRSALRRMAEAWVLRRTIVADLEQNRPVIVMGDMNDGEHAVSSEIIAGERAFKNYAWMLRHDAKHRSDRYSAEEDAQIRAAIDTRRLHSAEHLFARKSARDMIFTAAFGGNFESIDQIYLSHHFLAESSASIGEMSYFSALNDHLTDGSHPEAPYNKLASDHGQIMAHLTLKD